MKVDKLLEIAAGLGLCAASAGLILTPIPGDETIVGTAGVALLLDGFGVKV